MATGIELNYLLFLAGLLSIAVGFIHSVLGEYLIFKKLREESLVPAIAAPPLGERNIRIIWATWHLASVFGFAMGAMLIYLSRLTDVPAFIVDSIAASMCIGGLLVFIATKAKHPGWVGIMVVAVLCWLS